MHGLSLHKKKVSHSRTRLLQLKSETTKQTSGVQQRLNQLTTKKRPRSHLRHFKGLKTRCIYFYLINLISGSSQVGQSISIQQMALARPSQNLMKFAPDVGSPRLSRTKSREL